MAVPVIHWPRYPYAKWLIGGFMVLWIFALWFMTRAGTHFWGPQFYLLVVPMQLYVIIFNVRHVLSGGVLSVVRATGTVQHVPLAPAEPERTATGMRIRWAEGKRKRSITTKLSVPLMEELKRAVVAARSAEPGTMPATEAEAARAVSFGLPSPLHVVWTVLLVLPLMAFYVAATYWNQPLLLLPLVMIVFLIDREETNYLLMLSAERLWVLRPGKTPHPIPVKDVQGITNGTNTSVITTSDTNYPVMRLNRYQSGDFLKQLKRRLQ
jgi:hypothetical protein